jgi:hypothetical protein
MNDEVLNFYNQNKDCIYTPPNLPDGLSTLEKARWIMNSPAVAWVELDIEIDLGLSKQEIHNVENFYVPHRDGESQNWHACCLHGINTAATQTWVEYTNEENDDTYRWTELTDHVPYITNFWKEFPSEKFKRIRFMKVNAGGWIGKHSDAPGSGYEPGETIDYDPLELGSPINIAIVHPKDCYMVLEGFGCVPFKEGKAYLINIRHNHAVLNFSDQDRIHMIGFGVYGNAKEEFAKILVNSYERN